MKIRFSEQFTVNDLLNNAVSDLTASFLFDREHGSGRNTIKLFAVQVRNNQLYIHYRSYPTYSTDSTRVTSSGQEVRTEWYDTLFQFEDVAGNLGKAEDFKGYNKLEQTAAVRDFLEKGMCRVWDNCGAFYYQGHWEAMAGRDSTIFPFPGPKGTGEWQARHRPGLSKPGVTICKHIAACIPRLLKKDVGAIATELAKLDF